MRGDVWGRGLCPGRARGDPGRREAAVPARWRGRDPRHRARTRGHRWTRGDLAAYCRVCGFALREALPATYPHVLAFPLHMELLTNPAFPFPAIGLVHVANRITQHRPISLSETLSLSVRAGGLEPHAKGRTFTLLTEARVDDELVWEGVATNLRRGKGDEGADAPLGPEVDLEVARHRGRVAAARRPRAALRRRLGRPQPDPPLRADREGVRLPAPDRPRDVDEGALARPARRPPARRVHRRRRLQAPDPPARPRSSSRAPRAWAAATTSASRAAPASPTSPARSDLGHDT